MKKFNILFFSVIFIFITGFIFSSCQKNQQSTNEPTYSSDEFLAQSIFTNSTDIGNEAYNVVNFFKSSAAETNYLGGCSTITLDTNARPRVLTIDFGNTNCKGKDGRYRRGKILISFNGPYWKPGTVITYRFDNYFVNDNKISGSKSIINRGLNKKGHLIFTTEVIGVITKKDNGGTISWTSKFIREWARGMTTPKDRKDDVFLITGTSYGVRANGVAWESKIVKPLVKILSCKYFVAGTVNIKIQGRATRVLDYGEGLCDNIATITINGETKTITLK